MWVNRKIEVGDHARNILAVEIVVGAIYVTDAPVGVIIAICAGTEWSASPLRLSFPMTVIMAEAVHPHIRLAVVVFAQLPPRLLFFLDPLSFISHEPRHLPFLPPLRSQLLLKLFILGLSLLDVTE